MQAGEQVTDNLRLVRQLGQGGMGSVWVADHLSLGTQVAVKFMWRTFAQHPQFIERFRREASSAAQLKNPHVAQVFDHGVTREGDPFIAMELLEGEDLGKRIKREGPLPPAFVAEVLSQAAKALGKAHQLGIVHRDIKADNIFLTDLDGDVFVKVLDFGIAKVGGDMSMTSTGGTIGTPLYMSPEQLLSAKHVDHRADIWSLGVVAYHALTGTVPFAGDTIGAISVAVHTGVFHLPSTLRPDLSTGLDAWFQRVFRRNPDERFASAKEMADAFRAAIHSQAGPPPPLLLGALPPAPPPNTPSGSALAQSGGTGDGSPRTLDGRSVTVGGRTERRPGLIIAAIVGVGLAGAIAVVGITRPWEASASDPAVSASPEGTPSADRAPALPPPVTPAPPTASATVSGAPSGTASTEVAPTAAPPPSAAPRPTASVKPSSSPGARPKPAPRKGDEDVGF